MKSVAFIVANKLLVSNDIGILYILDVILCKIVKLHNIADMQRILKSKCILSVNDVEVVKFCKEEFLVDEVCDALTESKISEYYSRRDCAEDNVEMYYNIMHIRG